MAEKKTTTKKPATAKKKTTKKARRPQSESDNGRTKKPVAAKSKIIKKAAKPKVKKSRPQSGSRQRSGQKPKIKTGVPATAKAQAGKFAVVETGGKQYKIESGEILVIEKIAPAGRKKEYKEGDKITFDKVLLVDDGKDTKIGTPYLEGVKIEAEFTEEGRGKKIRILRFRSKSRSRRRVGHRQPYTKVKILSIK